MLLNIIYFDLFKYKKDNKTAIWWAVERGRIDVVKYLLQFNPDVEVGGGEDDDTPLLLATKRKRVGIVYELIKYGAKLSSTDRVKIFFFSRKYLFNYCLSSMEIIVYILLYVIVVEILRIFYFQIHVIQNIYIDLINVVKHHIKLMLVYKRVF
jgi:ankyrin repeat protein